MAVVEVIPDEDVLYHRLHINFLKDKKDIPPSAIRNTGVCDPPGMSTDWAKYSTPAEAKDRGPQPPEKYKIMEMIVGEVRKIPEQSVEHTPQKGHYAHATIYGPKDANHPEIRVKFTRIAKLLPDEES